MEADVVRSGVDLVVNRYGVAGHQSVSKPYVRALLMRLDMSVVKLLEGMVFLGLWGLLLNKAKVHLFLQLVTLSL